ncbi:hypothetical protein FOXB_01954 [Fusarium oxysporum f. sp. conglutinans Fo5176]|uniref:Uncharacterized protein n=2 Tax=Fusarium oxysporum f. sp. conglutinans TaxID=100902 RepID=F9F6C9_FUSOF|nr:hypothetical protein FOXB_01954 [Fusarium oxysporum f. sp. conglutinans Fo5176]
MLPLPADYMAEDKELTRMDDNKQLFQEADCRLTKLHFR